MKYLRLLNNVIDFQYGVLSTASALIQRYYSYHFVSDVKGSSFRAYCRNHSRYLVSFDG